MENKCVELKPCPFCGAEVEIIFQNFGIAGRLLCKNCKTGFLIPWNEAENRHDLANAWNRRAGENGQ